MNWPDDSDGDVFRSLDENNFNFDEPHQIDLNLDFDHWPLSESELALVSLLFANFEIVEPENEFEDIGNGEGVGYIEVHVESKLSYDFIVNLQRDTTAKIQSVGGFCNSWGVLS